MLIEVLPSACVQFLPYLEDKLVIVINTLRVTSTMVTALANGCQSIVPVHTPEEALEKRLMIPASLLAGEYKGEICEGFDLNYSTFEYVPEKVGGKRIIMACLPETKMINAVNGAQHIWLASFLNMDSIIHALFREFDHNKSLKGLVIVCTGTEGLFNIPDTLCAGMLIDALGPDVELNDLGEAARTLYNLSESNLIEAIRQSESARRMLQRGLERDMFYCSTPSILPIVPVVKQGEIVWLTDEVNS